MYLAAPLVLHPGDRPQLESLALSNDGRGLRARILLLAAEGVPNTDIARRLAVSRPTVVTWRKRYSAGGVAALADAPRSGRPAHIDEPAVVASTIVSPGRWTTRLLAAKLGVSAFTIGKVWRKWSLRSGGADRVRLPLVPAMEVRQPQVVGIYLNPPEFAVALRAEPRQAGSMNAVVPLLRRATGIEADACFIRRRNQDFIAFLKTVIRSHSAGRIDVVCGEYSSLHNDEVQRWLVANRRVHVHLTPPDLNWLHIVEVLLLLEKWRGATSSDASIDVDGVTESISAFVDSWGEQREYFHWVRPAGTRKRKTS